jgi:hypothetical protein
MDGDAILYRISRRPRSAQAAAYARRAVQRHLTLAHARIAGEQHQLAAREVVTPETTPPSIPTNSATAPAMESVFNTVHTNVAIAHKAKNETSMQEPLPVHGRVAVESSRSHCGIERENRLKMMELAVVSH